MFGYETLPRYVRIAFVAGMFVLAGGEDTVASSRDSMLQRSSLSFAKVKRVVRGGYTELFENMEGDLSEYQRAKRGPEKDELRASLRRYLAFVDTAIGHARRVGATGTGATTLAVRRNVYGRLLEWRARLRQEDLVEREKGTLLEQAIEEFEGPGLLTAPGYTNSATEENVSPFISAAGSGSLFYPGTHGGFRGSLPDSDSYSSSQKQ